MLRGHAGDTRGARSSSASRLCRAINRLMVERCTSRRAIRPHPIHELAKSVLQSVGRSVKSVWFKPLA